MEWYGTIKKINKLIDEYLEENPNDFEIRGYKLRQIHLDAPLDKLEYEYIFLLGEADYYEKVVEDYDKAIELYKKVDEKWKECTLFTGMDISEIKIWVGEERIDIINNKIESKKKKDILNKINESMKKYKKDPEKLNEIIPLIDKSFECNLTNNQTAKMYRYYGDIALANDKKSEALDYYKKSTQYKEFKYVLNKIEKLEKIT